MRRNNMEPPRDPNNLPPDFECMYTLLHDILINNECECEAWGKLWRFIHHEYYKQLSMLVPVSDELIEKREE
jgi:hypothetical protein